MKLQSTLKAWVARDYDGSIYMYTQKPKKKSVFWHAPKVGYLKLNDSLFPEVQWSDEEPKEIGLSIHNKDDSLFPEVQWSDEEPTELTFTIKK